jgi:hypothetical protein
MNESVNWNVLKFQFRFVVQRYLRMDPKLSCQVYLQGLFSDEMLACRTNACRIRGPEDDERNLTPGKSQQKVVLTDLKYLVMQPMLCKFSIMLIYI